MHGGEDAKKRLKKWMAKNSGLFAEAPPGATSPFTIRKDLSNLSKLVVFLFVYTVNLLFVTPCKYFDRKGSSCTLGIFLLKHPI